MVASYHFQKWEDHFSNVDTSIVLTLQKNPPEAMREAGEILIKLIRNVIRDPVCFSFYYFVRPEK
jgi:hypothetical protein